jgi:hypothetical protein
MRTTDRLSKLQEIAVGIVTTGVNKIATVRQELFSTKRSRNGGIKSSYESWTVQSKLGRSIQQVKGSTQGEKMGKAETELSENSKLEELNTS